MTPIEPDSHEKSPSKGLLKLRAELDALEPDRQDSGDSAEQDLHTKHIICSDGIRREFVSKEKIRQALKSLEDGITMHTVPEGKDLVTRSYVKNSIEFTRKELNL